MGAARAAILLAALLLAGATGTAAQTPADHRRADDAAGAGAGAAMRAHLAFLADDALEGRAPGTRGGELAARYVAAQFRRIGLVPAGDSGSYFQHFTYPSAAGTAVRTVNVVARLPGRDSAGGELVVLGAHYDHLGIGAPVSGDSIYNGAQDNAAGVAALLAAAEALVRDGARPRRSLLFVAFGAEEAGLRGARALLLRPPAPRRALVAMLNFEGMNLYGRTLDAAALGAGYSSLGDDFRRAAAAEGLVVAGVARRTEEEFFRRSDQLAFAETGVPALMTWFGERFVGRPDGWAARAFADYFARHYHQPSDELLPEHGMDGAMQQVRLFMRIALAVANAADRPTWKPEAPYGME